MAARNGEREGPRGGRREEEMAAPLIILLIIGGCFVLGLIVLSLSLWLG